MLSLKLRKSLRPERLKRLEVNPRHDPFNVMDDMLEGSYRFMRELLRGDDGVIRRVIEVDGLELEVPLHGETWQARLGELVDVSRAFADSSGIPEAKVLSLLLEGDGWVLGDNVSPPLWLDGSTVMMCEFLEVANELGARLEEVSKEA